MPRRKWFVRTTLSPALLIIATGCADSAGPKGDARIRVLLTDAPSDVIASAEVWISSAYLTPLPDGGERVNLLDASTGSRSYDLLQLRDGVTADLTGVVTVESGEYHQLRLIVDSAFITLAEGFAFNDGTTTRSLMVPSAAQTGIKVLLTDPVDAQPGDLVTLIVDFDVDRNFVIQGNPDTPAGIHGILFTPVLEEKSRSTSTES